MKLIAISGKVGAGLLLTALALGTAGCGSSKESTPELGNRLKAQSENQATAITKANSKEVSRHLEQLATGIKGVRGANCVVFGKYAVVGIDVEPTLERSRVGTIKYAVAEAFRKDPYGIDAVVTADIDMGERIREIRADVNKGRPIAGFAEEMADIVGRLIPQMPRSVVPPASPDGTGTISKMQVQSGGHSSHSNTPGK
jgi:YhcN/YlaJ family sporulation lipoprotein